MVHNLQGKKAQYLRHSEKDNKKIIMKEVVAAKTFSVALEDIYDYVIKVT